MNQVKIEPVKEMLTLHVCYGQGFENTTFEQFSVSCFPIHGYGHETTFYYKI